MKNDAIIVGMMFKINLTTSEFMENIHSGIRDAYTDRLVESTIAYAEKLKLLYEEAFKK